ncbi:50S ribosomal protein L11 methyltransferase [Phaeocystidibacter luteus]|uniref:Ribosomal protein L11 methyltransferase n=1 Tax=Phaeocystidibacter luteus TaxID=911197 RepID=A0A6N6RFT5_9FLAO|nr:50S ribosomal protein L11 methyltransferase [Phaeocystidibacter luteus]KAB2810025.1 50S ribosomal protein L11 methyltransferase [Phaeocystidibacter luteus]
MNYIKLTFHIEPLEPGRDILYAELDALAVESAVDTDKGIDAFIPEDQYTEITAGDFPMTSSVADLNWTTETVEQQNWNAEWEKNFNPIEVDGKLFIRAPFHESRADDFDYEIIIEPKMSFGTGHHQTTWMMCSYLLDLDLGGKAVLDMGCGTAVLAILAKMRGSGFTEGIDIEEWAAENSKENAERNGHPDIVVYHGDASLLGERKYDVIIANINRNILLNDLSKYVDVLNPGGQLLLSGFYESDIPQLESAGRKLGMTPSQQQTKDTWAALIWNKD